jgi:hypothetical protein
VTTKKTIDRLLGELRRAQDLVQERRPDEAVSVYREIVGEARKVGLDSAHLHWAFAAACDYSGELEMAFEQITLAIGKDPLAPPFRHSFEVITGRIQAALADPERAADDPSTRGSTRCCSAATPPTCRRTSRWPGITSPPESRARRARSWTR